MVLASAAHRSSRSHSYAGPATSHRWLLKSTTTPAAQALERAAGQLDEEVDLAAVLTASWGGRPAAGIAV